MLAGAPIPLVLDPLTGVVSTAPPPTEKPPGDTVQYRLIVKGEPPPAVSGRVDDFSWPPGQRQPQAFLAPSAAAPVADPPLAEAPAADATGKAVLTPVSKSN